MKNIFACKYYYKTLIQTEKKNLLKKLTVASLASQSLQLHILPFHILS